MSRRIVLVLSGGGALGAYQCGAYRALTRRLNADARRSMVIVGASIGAVNGFLIATRSADPDAGVAAMERFWRSLTIPSAQFFPVPDPYYQRLNATLTGLVFGNPFAVVGIPGGLLGGLLYYPHTAAFSHANLISATTEVAGDSYSPEHEGPRLMIRAIDIAAASPVWFDSNDEAIVPSMIGASSSIP
ncbi:MAG: patatin-like phospholipase family protein, partial [Aquisalimonadaceae bacterium]